MFSLSNILSVYGEYRRESTSFQTESGKVKAAERPINEWVMSCRPKRDGEYEDTWDYFLFHAYENNKIFVYFKERDTWKIFTEN